MIKPKAIKLKYPFEMKILDGVLFRRCGRCGEFHPEKEFIEDPKKSLKRTAYCSDCRKFMGVYE